MVEMVKMNGKMIVGTSSYQMDEDEEGYAAVSEVVLVVGLGQISKIVLLNVKTFYIFKNLTFLNSEFQDGYFNFYLNYFAVIFPKT